MAPSAGNPVNPPGYWQSKFHQGLLACVHQLFFLDDDDNNNGVNAVALLNGSREAVTVLLNNNDTHKGYEMKNSQVGRQSGNYTAHPAVALCVLAGKQVAARLNTVPLLVWGWGSRLEDLEQKSECVC